MLAERVDDVVMTEESTPVTFMVYVSSCPCYISVLAVRSKPYARLRSSLSLVVLRVLEGFTMAGMTKDTYSTQCHQGPGFLALVRESISTSPKKTTSREVLAAP